MYMFVNVHRDVHKTRDTPDKTYLVSCKTPAEQLIQMNMAIWGQGTGQ